MCTTLEDLNPSEIREAFINGTVDSSSVDLTEIATLLRMAVLKNDTEYASAIIDEVPNVLKHDNGGGKILWHALENGNETLAEKFIHAGADLNYRSRNGSSFLHRFMVEYPKLAVLMIENGADINITDSSNNTILYVAVREGLQNIVDKVSKQGNKYKDQRKILELAARTSYAGEFLPLLIRSPCTTVVKYRANKALYFYIKMIHESDLKIYDLYLVRNLIDLILLPKYTANEVIELLKIVVKFKYLANVVRNTSVKLLLNYVTGLNGKSEEVATLLCFAAQHPKSTISSYLIKKGANINSPTKDYEYPLHEACRYGSLQNIHLFLSLGADLNATNARGYTPFCIMASEPFNENHKIVIRHLVLMKMKGILIHPGDLAKIAQSHDMSTYFEQCMNELWIMKQTKIYKDVPFYCFFSKSLEELCDLVRHVGFLKTYYLNQKERTITFVHYSMHIHNILKMAIERKNILLERAKIYEDACYMDYPPYSEINRGFVDEDSDLENFEQRFYFDLHERINKQSELGYHINLLY